MTKPNNRPGKLLATWAVAFTLAGASHAQGLAGLWNFTSGDLASDLGGGQPLQYAGSTDGTSFGTSTSFGIPDIDGSAAPVMKVDAVQNGGYRMPITVGPNGGSASFVNDYTLVVDVFFPTESGTVKRPLLETDLGLVNTTEGAEFYVSDAGEFSGVGNARGTVSANAWHRLGIVVEGSNDEVRLYIDGQEQGSFPAGGLNGRLAINPSSAFDPYAELFKDLGGQTALSYINSIQFRDTALSPGQMQALAGPTASGIPQVIPPVAPYFRSRTPAPNATGVVPNPTVTAVLDQGDRTITPDSVKLQIDGSEVAANVTTALPTFTISYTVPELLSPESTHTLTVAYTDNVAGAQTASWTFKVAKYQQISLPAPIYPTETFDSIAEGGLPAGWTVTNRTDAGHTGVSYTDLESDAYLDWAIIAKTTAQNWVSGDYSRRAALPPIVLNGSLLPALFEGNFAYAESDQRSGSQVQVMFTKDYDLTGIQNVFLSFWSSYEQNQDNMAAVEYSVDGGTTWLPVVYMVDDEDKNADVLYSDEAKTQIDAVATLNTAREDQAYGLAYGAFIGAPVSQDLAPYISGRINDDSFESKRVELFRLPAADNAATVRFRFMQAGTASWYWGIDNVGLYSINTPVITQSPTAQTVSAGDDVTFTVVATINPPYTYQWLHDNNPIPNSDTDALTLTGVDAVDAGEYKVIVTNGDGPTTSQAAVLTVITAPQITSQPQSVLVSAGAPASLTVAALGRNPFTFQWYQGATPVGGNSATLSFAEAATGDSGDYTVKITNADGDVTSDVATVTVFDGPVTQDLVTHLAFDGDLTDASGKAHNGTAVGNIPFGTGAIGQSAGFSTTVANGRNYITLGAPTDFNFGTGDFTISFWIKYTERHSDPAVFSNKNWDSGGNQGWVFAPSGNGLKWNVADSTRTRADSSGLGTLNDGQWHHYITSFHRADRATTFIDGVQASTVDISAMIEPVDTPAGLAVNIGEDGTGAYNDDTTGSPGFADAMIDDLGVWRRALTPEEAKAVATAGKQGKDLTQAIAVVPTLGTLTATPNGGSLDFNWNSAAGVRLQSTTTLTPPNWQDVPNTTGTGSISLPVGPGNEYFRLIQP